MDRNEKEKIREKIDRLAEKLNSTSLHIKVPDWKKSEAAIKYKCYLLNEAYKRNDNIDWLDVFKKIKLMLTNKLSLRDWAIYKDKLKLDFDTDIEEGISGNFDPKSQVIVMQFSRAVLTDIMLANEAKLKELADNFWVNFCHEDTHRQQHSKAGEHYGKDYIPPADRNWNADLDKNAGYFNQLIEADAHGREIGARLRAMYPDRKASEIFKDLNDGEITESFCVGIVNAYKDSRISQKARRAFFRALYDYLEDYEDESGLEY